MVAVDMERDIFEEKVTRFGIWLGIELEEEKGIVKKTIWETEKKIVPMKTLVLVHKD